MHSRWLEVGRGGDFLTWLRELGVSALEFKPNPSAPDWAETQPLIEESYRRGFRLSFHAPYKAPYNPAGFSGADRREIEQLYRPALAYAAGFGQVGSPVSLVVHGAKGPRPRAELRRDTLSFLKWITDEFPSLCPNIELLARSRQKTKVGDNKAELLEIVSELGSRAGICWDLGHDARNGAQPPPPGFTVLVRHVHVHDISPDGRDHSPLIFGNVPYERYLSLLAGAGYAGTVILEVNGHLVARFATARGAEPLQVLATSLERLGRAIELASSSSCSV